MFPKARKAMGTAMLRELGEEPHQRKQELTSNMWGGAMEKMTGLHLFTINVLFPKVIGKRLHLNPLIVTIGLFVWSSIWGAMGLILAVPITGAIKIIFDHVEILQPFGAWMEE